MLERQRNMGKGAMEKHCLKLVEGAREGLGSGPDLSQPPKSGVTMASLEDWAQSCVPASPAVHGVQYLGIPDKTNQETSQSSSYAQSSAMYNDSSVYSTNTADTQYTANTHDWCDSQATLPLQEEPLLIKSFSARNSTIDVDKGAYSNLQETHRTNPAATTALIEREVNPDTQTESEVDSYVTLRPSQSISQVYNPHPFDSQCSSPPPVDEQDLTLWHDGQVGLGSISQDHADDFFRMYSGEAGSNAGV
ncbi:hypothetical protein RhiJN_25160 [Ceratobasidium sp. AG-Ba]|nr:hypothetical protein RhiJN_25160 [Ceratobasidium sp. AG-Ba]